MDESRWCSWGPLVVKPRCMPAQVLFDEGRNEVVTVVVVRLQPQRQRNARVCAFILESLGSQLLDEEPVGHPLIDPKFGGASPGSDQRTGVVLRPSRSVAAEVARKGLLAPRALGWRDDGCEGR